MDHDDPKLALGQLNYKCLSVKRKGYSITLSVRPQKGTFAVFRVALERIWETNG